MAGITLAQAQENLNLWIAASAAVAGSQSYTIAGRTLTRANLSEITRMIEFWEKKVATLSGTTRKPTRYITGGA